MHQSEMMNMNQLIQLLHLGHLLRHLSLLQHLSILSVQPFALLPGNFSRGGTGKWMHQEFSAALNLTCFELLQESLIRISRCPDSGKSALEGSHRSNSGYRSYSVKTILEMIQSLSCLPGFTLHQRFGWSRY